VPTQTDTQNTAWTAGPWRVEDVGIPAGSLAIMAGSATEYRWLATVSEDVEARIDWTQTQANARLIANAPRLLKTAVDLWHANVAEGPDRDELLIASAWAELIDAIEAADGSRP
jgi:hypothetical protein